MVSPLPAGIQSSPVPIYRFQELPLSLYLSIKEGNLFPKFLSTSFLFVRGIGVKIKSSSQNLFNGNWTGLPPVERIYLSVLFLIVYHRMVWSFSVLRQYVYLILLSFSSHSPSSGTFIPHFVHKFCRRDSHDV